MGALENEWVLHFDDLEPMGDDGMPQECACCALAEGREPRQVGVSLTSKVMDLASSMLELVGKGRRSDWQGLLFFAAEAWNAAVEEERTRPVGQPAPRFEVEVVDPETRLPRDAPALSGWLASMIEAKLARYPGDDRFVDEVRVSEFGDVWCKPGSAEAIVTAKAG